MISRRALLKGFALTPLAAAIPAIAVKPQPSDLTFAFVEAYERQVRLLAIKQPSRLSRHIRQVQ